MPGGRGEVGAGRDAFARFAPLSYATVQEGLTRAMASARVGSNGWPVMVALCHKIYVEATQEIQNPFALAPEGKKKLLLIGLLLAVFGSIMQSTTLSIMLPMAVPDIGGQDIYSLASALGAPLGIVGMPLYGYIAARHPSVKVPLMVFSYVVGCAALALRFVAWDMWVIIVAMVFWGMVSPATFVLGYSIIRDMYDAKKAGAYLGMCGTAIYSVIIGMAGIVGGMPIALTVAAVFAVLTFICALFLQKLPAAGEQA